MRVKDVVHFSPSFKVEDIDFNQPSNLLEAFKDRVISYYLVPIQIVNNRSNVNHAFAAGTLLMTTIDSLTNMFETGGVGNRFKNFALKMNGISHFLDEVKIMIANKFYDDFRNGLIHEGRIKNCGQFCYDFQQLIYIDNNTLIINPVYLENEVRIYYEAKLNEFNSNQDCRDTFITNFKQFYETEINDFVSLQ